MPGDSCDDQNFQLGVVTGNLNALREQFQVHLASTDARFTRLEDRIAQGFSALSSEIKALQKGQAGATSGFKLLDRALYFAIVLAAACLGPWLEKHL